MAGGLLNLIAIGNQNIILNGNPTKSFFKNRYAKYTNFGLQKYRVDTRGNNKIEISRETPEVTFKIPRYGDLLMDTYLVINLPDIYSPILNISGEHRPYEFKWIKNIGTQLIKEVRFFIGSALVQKFSGSYLQNMVERDFDANKKELFNIMTGNISELNDPANYADNNNNYPNAYYETNSDISGIEPSIRGQQLYIPINIWFTLMSTMALPLICLQYAELEIRFDLRPLSELFTIRDVLNKENYDNNIRIKADQNENAYLMYKFTNPPDVSFITQETTYDDIRVDFNPDVHLITTQCFLDNEERTLFANNTQEYLIKEVYEYDYEKVNKSSKVKLESSNGLVSNWMWHFQRNDVKLRNEWSNYTNWPYENIRPYKLTKLKNNNTEIFYSKTDLYQIQDLSKNIYITGNSPSDFEQKNFKSILNIFSIICDGKTREDDFPEGVYSKVEKYTRTSGNSKDGLYHYNFGLNSDPYKYQPSGAFNTNKFKNVEFEFDLTSNPPIDPVNVNFTTICDPETGEIIATSKEPTSIYKYNYNLHIYEERYNILTFQSGLADLMYSR